MDPESIHQKSAELWNARKIDEIAALAGRTTPIPARTEMSDLGYRPASTLRDCLRAAFPVQR